MPKQDLPQTRSIQVAIPGPHFTAFTYKLPFGMTIHLGDRVRIPFGARKVVGYVIGLDVPAYPRAKEVVAKLDTVPIFDRSFFEFCVWVGRYYLTPPGQLFSLVYPRAASGKVQLSYRWGESAHAIQSDLLKQQFRPKPGSVVSASTIKRIEKQFKKPLHELERLGVIVQSSERQSNPRYLLFSAELLAELGTKRKPSPTPFDSARTRAELTRLGWSNGQIARAIEIGAIIHESSISPNDPSGHRIPETTKQALLSLNEQQTRVFSDISSGGLKKFETHLLQGVTGSGKTLVYAHLIKEMLSRGKQVLVLAPEIALAEHVARVLAQTFDQQVIRWHSGLKESDKRESWKRMTSEPQTPLIVVGPRSALFAPLRKLGLIIVDEEHDAAFKQAEQPPYFHARDAAIKRAQLANIPILLGSATPSLESYYQSTQGKFKRHLLSERATTSPLPTVRIIDMRSDRLTGDLGLLSASLKRAIDSCLSRNEQAILFYNRRGYSPLLTCESCGWSAKCEYCRQTLTYHRTTKRLHCHFCGGTEKIPTNCPSCSFAPLEPEGHGTQRIESLLPRLFPTARIIRYDLDSTRHAEKAAEALRTFARGDADILLGTQMVTKGLDFPKVSLVGVLAADQGMHHVDFRATERTFARLVQVAGRSGRSDSPGEVLIQTFAPEHPMMEMITRHDFDQFAESELLERRAQEFPPFRRMLRIVTSASSAAVAQRAIGEIVARLKQWSAKESPSTIIRGPAACPIEFVRGEYRFHAMVQTKQMTKLTDTIYSWLEADPRLGFAKSVRLRLDVDPMEMQ